MIRHQRFEVRPSCGSITRFTFICVRYVPHTAERGVRLDGCRFPVPEQVPVTVFISPSTAFEQARGGALGVGGGRVGFAGGGLFRVGRGERSAPRLRLLSRPRFRPSRGRAVCRWVWNMVVRTEVRLCDPCARVRPCVPCVSKLARDGPCKLMSTSSYTHRHVLASKTSRRTSATWSRQTAYPRTSSCTGMCSAAAATLYNHLDAGNCGYTLSREACMQSHARGTGCGLAGLTRCCALSRPP